MNQKRLKEAQERFKHLDPVYVADCIEEAFRYHLMINRDILTHHAINRAVASVMDNGDRIRLFKIGYEMAEEYQATKLYRLLEGHNDT